MPDPIYKLAGQQGDAFVEEVLATLFSDRPERTSVRPKDSRRHWQWWARDPRGQTSRIWISWGEPITDDTPGDLKARGEAALAVFIPDYARRVEVIAKQVSFDEVNVEVLFDGAVIVATTIQGGSSA